MDESGIWSQSTTDVTFREWLYNEKFEFWLFRCLAEPANDGNLIVEKGSASCLLFVHPSTNIFPILYSKKSKNIFLQQSTEFVVFIQRKLWVKYLLCIAGLHVRSGVEDLRMTAETNPVAPPGGEADYAKSYDSEYARMEAWLDEHPDFVQDYFLRWKKQFSFFSFWINLMCL